MNRVSVGLLIAGLSLSVALGGCEKPPQDDAEPGVEPAAAEAPSDGDESAGDEKAAKADEEQAETAGGEVKAVEFDKNLPDGVEVEGKVVDGIQWTDDQGENLVVFGYLDVPDKPLKLEARHWRKPASGEWTQVRKFIEVIKDCDVDVTLEPLTGDWSVSDLDGDGVGEATFAWRAGCRGGRDPIPFKVLVTEDGEKYVLRGKTEMVVSPDDTVLGGEYKADPAFDKAPEGFLAHAEKVWKKNVREQ